MQQDLAIRACRLKKRHDALERYKKRLKSAVCPKSEHLPSRIETYRSNPGVWHGGCMAFHPL